MKIVTDNTATIERIGVGTDQAFKINFDAKMAKILADGLYSDKVQSVIRELSCNAYDSHVMAGCADRPIEVHFPNRFEPWFHVRDFGTGLSHEDVLNIYTTYGASTKTMSNDVIGQLGLGSKSPFALTDAFTVTTRKDGVENHYSMYRSETGMPSVAHLHSQPTTESNGVCVTVPVSKDLREEFMRKAQTVFKWFPVKPVAIGDSVTYETVEYLYQGTGWGIRKPLVNNRSYYGHRSAERPVAIMGLVAYPLDSNSIKGLPKGAEHLMSTPVVLNFDIGDLEVAANREALGYDERTCANIVARISVMIRELGEKFEQEIAGAKSLWYARQRFGEIFSKNDYAYEFSNAYKNLGLKWNNEVVKSTSCLVKLGDLYPSQTVLNGVSVDADVYEASYRYKRPRKIHCYNGNSWQIECENHTVVIFNDLKLGGMSRVIEYHKANDYKKNIAVFNPSTKASWDKISDVLGNPDVVYTSSLPKPPRKEVKRTSMLKWTGGYSGKKAWHPVEIDLNQGGYYVVLDGWDVINNTLSGSDISWHLKNAIEANIIPAGTDVYAMRGKNKAIVSEQDNWQELFTAIKQGLEKKIATNNIAQEIADAEEIRKMSAKVSYNFWEPYFIIKDPNSLFSQFKESICSIRDNSKVVGIDAIKALATRYNIALNTATPTCNWQGMLDQVLDAYPMVSFIANWHRYPRPTPADLKKLEDYINFVDTCRPFYNMQDSVTD